MLHFQNALLFLVFMQICELFVKSAKNEENINIDNLENDYFSSWSSSSSFYSDFESNSQNAKLPQGNSKFLNFLPEEMEELDKFGNQKCSCGKHLLREMQKIEYGDWHFRVWPVPLGQGTTSNVFHAHAMAELLDFDGRPLKLEKCVALKSVLLSKAGTSLEEEMRNEIKILKAFARIGAKRVIRLFSFKDISLNRQLLFLLELGEKDLFKIMEEMEAKWFKNEKIVKENIEEKLGEILEVVREMHKLVIHLDFKPENMLYVREANGKLTLKAIDFGGSEMIPENSKLKTEKRANSCKLRLKMWSTKFYVSPEQQKYCSEYPGHYGISIKCDIWAVGVMLLEMILMDPIFRKRISDFDESLQFIVGLYRGDEGQFVTNEIREIVNIARNKFHRIFDILAATLNESPIERPTARGLLDYLSGKCHLKMPQNLLDSFSKQNNFSGFQVHKLKSMENIRNYEEKNRFKFRESMNEMPKGLTIFDEEMPECDLQTTGNPLAISKEENSKEGEERKGKKNKIISKL